MDLKNMNSVLRLLVVISIASTLTIGLSSGWNSGIGKTHEHIAAKLYSDMPANIKKKLDISEMKKGASYPDKLDAGKKYRHSYPASVNLVEKNLKEAMTYYHKARNAKTATERAKYYKQESYHLGMASHYISDTFTAPHTTYMKNYKVYYGIADKVTNIKGTKLPQSKYNLKLKNHKDLDILLKYGKDEGYKKAQDWNKKEIWKYQGDSKSLATSNLNLAYAGTLAIFKQWLGF